jgi:prefoldin subunit 2
MASNQEANLRKQQGMSTMSSRIWRSLIVEIDLQNQYTNYKNTLQSLAQKVGEIEQEIEEHKSVLFFMDLRFTCTDAQNFRLVTETLQPLPQDRKCFRLTNGILVERTIKDVLPALKTNSDGLKQVLDELVKQYKTKQDEMDNWKVLVSDHSHYVENLTA